jgi:prepilin-type N-terminal cleavage/methylation domain-containing protein
MAQLRRRRSGGFTLIELMMVVAIIGILASIMMPKYAQLLQKSQEGAAKGNLGTMRSTLEIYYADNQGIFPSCTAGPLSTVFDTILVPKYINRVPEVKTGLHNPVATVYCDYEMVAGSIHDGQGWYYDGALPHDGSAGGIWIACDHTDSKSRDWTSY